MSSHVDSMGKGKCAAISLYIHEIWYYYLQVLDTKVVFIFTVVVIYCSSYVVISMLYERASFNSNFNCTIYKTTLKKLVGN